MSSPMMQSSPVRQGATTVWPRSWARSWLPRGRAR